MYEDYCPTSRTICVDFELPNETLRYWWYQGWYSIHITQVRRLHGTTQQPLQNERWFDASVWWLGILCLFRLMLPELTTWNPFLLKSAIGLYRCTVSNITLPPIMVGKCGLPWSRLSVAGYSLEAEPFRPQVVKGYRKVPAQKGWHGWLSNSMMFHEW